VTGEQHEKRSTRYTVWERRISSGKWCAELPFAKIHSLCQGKRFRAVVLPRGRAIQSQRRRYAVDKMRTKSQEWREE
jgi:hypothetical protein